MTDGTTVTGTELRGFLRDRIPPWCLPDRFVIVPRLPLNSNGKVDRTAAAALAARG